VPLTAKEYRALALLDARRGALVSKDELAAHVWPEYDGAVADCNLTQLVARLRRKLEGDEAEPPMLVTVRGLGYRLVAN
jgi:DNA-binding response OmpR family regulator